MSKEIKGDGICLLSFDSGGPGTFSQLLIIQEIMNRLADDLEVDREDIYPADYFELMGGVGFGGLAALFLGHLRMSVEEAIESVISVATAAFPHKLEGEIDPEGNLARLKEAVEQVLENRRLPRDLRLDDDQFPFSRCKVALYAGTSTNMNHPYIFRTYRSNEPSINATVVDALCATIAVPSLFSAVRIGPELIAQSFIGGALGANNPTRELFKEGISVFKKDRRVAQIISLGSGSPRALSVTSLTSSEGIGQLLRFMTADSEILAKDLGTRLFNVDVYTRFSVDKGMEDLNMDDWDGLGDIASHTGAYIEKPSVAKAIEVCLKHLREKIGTITLGKLSHSTTIRFAAKKAPAVTPYYVLREEEMGLMLKHLADSTAGGQKIFCITGVGGCGKTQLVSGFLQGCQSLYLHVVFVDASSPSSIKADLQAWARSLGDGHEHDLWEDALKLLGNGTHEGHWVLILDAADDLSVNLVTFLPKCYNGTIIITSRNKSVGNLAKTHHLELGRMKGGEALSALLLAARRELPIPPEELKSAQILIEEMGYLVAALVQAGTYCHQLSSTVQGEFQPYTFTQYLALFNHRREELMKKAEPSSLDRYQRGAYTALDLWQRVTPKSIA